jgi:hypothetical protein
LLNPSGSFPHLASPDSFLMKAAFYLLLTPPNIPLVAGCSSPLRLLLTTPHLPCPKVTIMGPGMTLQTCQTHSSIGQRALLHHPIYLIPQILWCRRLVHHSRGTSFVHCPSDPGDWWIAHLHLPAYFMMLCVNRC